MSVSTRNNLKASLADIAATLTPLQPALVGTKLVVLDTVNSTNTHALNHGGDGIVYITERQQAGRGRHGHVWHSAAGLGLWFSVAFEGAPIPGLTFGAALAVRDALRPYAPLEIKWPNDLLIQKKKVCGILVEQRKNRTALGIGLNVHQQQQDFPEELRGVATSLEMATGTCFERGAILRAVLTHLDQQVMLLRSGGYEGVHHAWTQACNLIGQHICRDGFEGTVMAIDDTGALLVQEGDIVRRVVTGEIIRINGE